ncbi:MAG: hypothetical protein WAK00_03245 [Microbacterium sp.]|uniref:phosphorylase family protein n=1 Tax=Microbacterium sp. TaxID=51671 RepID=UPI003BAFCB82
MRGRPPSLRWADEHPHRSSVRRVRHGALAVEMETSALYTLAAFHGRRALSICTVSDHLVTHEETTALEREQTFGDMVSIALGAATSV